MMSLVSLHQSDMLTTQFFFLPGTMHGDQQHLSKT